MDVGEAVPPVKNGESDGIDTIPGASGMSELAGESGLRGLGKTGPEVEGAVGATMVTVAVVKSVETMTGNGEASETGPVDAGLAREDEGVTLGKGATGALGVVFATSVALLTPVMVIVWVWV